MSRLERHEAIARAVRCGADLELLRTLLERHVIPQLAERSRALVERPPIDPGLIDGLMARVMVDDEAGAQEAVEVVVRLGGCAEHLISACAARLGQAWESDGVSFVQVTAALGVLARIVSRESDGLVPASTRGGVVLTTAPGEQHTLGLQLVAQALRRDGWSVDVEPGLEPAALSRRVAAGAVDAVGFTVSRAALLPPLACVIEALRLASPTPPAVMVGGPLPLQRFAEAACAKALTCPESAVQWLREVRPARASRIAATVG